MKITNLIISLLVLLIGLNCFHLKKENEQGNQVISKKSSREIVQNENGDNALAWGAEVNVTKQTTIQQTPEVVIPSQVSVKEVDTTTVAGVVPALTLDSKK